MSAIGKRFIDQFKDVIILNQANLMPVIMNTCEGGNVVKFSLSESLILGSKFIDQFKGIINYGEPSTLNAV